MAVPKSSFASLNRAYNAVFEPGQLSVGLVVPIDAYPNGPIPALQGQAARIVQAEELGFAAVWLRDVPFNVPSFGDAGQVYDPFVLLGLLAGQTENIALGVASIILPLRHPAHVAKAAASVDALSGGRLLLGVASGDRPQEYPALGASFEGRGQRFRDSFEYIRKMGDEWPTFDSPLGSPSGVDMLPKPSATALPLLITGGSQQSPEWVAGNGDGWMTYPRPLAVQARVIADYRRRVRDAGRNEQPVMQPLYIDLADNDDAPPTPIHLGLRLGMNALRDHLDALQQIGVNHLALNLRFNRANIDRTLDRLASSLLQR